MKTEYQSQGYFNHSCGKTDCYFCYKMGLIPHLIKPYVEPKKRLWTISEMNIIKDDFSIIPIIDGRTYRQVLEKRWRLAFELGITLPKSRLKSA